MDSLGLLEQRAAHSDPAVSRPALAQKARLQSASATNAAAWLVAIPSEPSLSLCSTSCAFAMRHRFGLWPDDDMPFLCVCGMDPRSHHAHFHACKKLKRLAITWRHDLVMATLRLSGQEAGALVLLEDHSRRSAWPDIHSFVPTDTRANTSSGRIVTGVGIGCPTIDSYLSAAQVQAAIAEARSTAKYTKYLDLCSVMSALNVPFTLETYGALSRSAAELLSRFVSALICGVAQHTSHPCCFSCFSQATCQHLPAEGQCAPRGSGPQACVNTCSLVYVFRAK